MSSENLDISESLRRISVLVDPSAHILAPSHIAEWLFELANDLESAKDFESPPSPTGSSARARGVSESSSGSSGSPPLIPSETRNTIAATRIQHDVKINRKTTLSVLYTYEDVDFCLEYPETSTKGVGYLMKRDPLNWTNPLLDVAYSRGKPEGQNKKGKEETCSLLTNGPTLVLCKKIHATCQGVKICPQAADASVPHCSASPELVRERLRVDMETYAAGTSPNRLVFEKTAALITALRTTGCGSRESTETPALAASEQQAVDFLKTHHSRMQRGYEPAVAQCTGRVSLEYNHEGKALVVCEFNSSSNRFHLCRFLDESYDLDYLEAYFNEDDDELERIEEAASRLGYGPLATCRNVANFSSQRYHCSFDHRDDAGRLVQLPMKNLSCTVKFTLYEPLLEFRQNCPYVLLVCKGEHPHPIPLLTKTPPRIQDDLLVVLKSLDGDLADLTPRRFLRHPVLRAYLQQRFPQLPNPTLIDLHTSLANREHLRVYIKSAKVNLFPEGTGWKGVLRLKEWQDHNLGLEEHYIRCIIDVPDFPTDEFDSDEALAASNVPDASPNLRAIVCMTPNGSRRLKKSQYVQSDIGFQRIEGFHEFEIASMDSFANTSVIFLRIYLNRQTALAHKLILDAVNSLVTKDTGSGIRWRHLHATSSTETPCETVLLWTADQHGGQAKGLGLHLQAIAGNLGEKYDLHEPHRLLSDLGPYEHLHRVFRLCEVHGKRNIRKCAVSDEVRNLMRSLMCVRHPTWDATLQSIRDLGGKAGTDWVNDKSRSQFAFEGWCWEKSHIPEIVWKAGQSHSNLVESVHADVNREGVRCTLLGGLKKGLAFDTQKMKTLQTFEEYFIRPSYKSGHISENAIKSLKRKNTAQHRNLSKEDEKISAQNVKTEKAFNTFNKAAKQRQISSAFLQAVNPQTQAQLYRARQQELNKSDESCKRAETKYLKELESAGVLDGSGSGKVAIWKPPLQSM
ncbi:hypothetical protein R3P38DRAFT_3196030 [Favolaschia claudopus]|uniref:Uncharacterized protein n=1 Tax=Favolaschia claudopus TaxID=2862362 RepID=A0AAW0B935_9AGAR